MSVTIGEVTIGEAARLSGVKVNTIRFYEGRGLLPAPPRSDGNQRLYGSDHVARLRFIRHARDLGFPLPEVAELLDLAHRPEAPCDAADAIARRQLAEVQRRISQLQSLAGELERMIGFCAHDRVATCRILETLADHALCATDHHAGRDATSDVAIGTASHAGP